MDDLAEGIRKKCRDADRRHMEIWVELFHSNSLPSDRVIVQMVREAFSLREERNRLQQILSDMYWNGNGDSPHSLY